MEGTVVARPAPAKINLTLRVVGRRPDGYHLLDSLVAFAGIGDVVTVRAAPELTLSLSGPFGPALSNEADNLVLRAARLLADHLGRPPAAAINLEKRLPIASGIGGGSADAAATLLALGELWQAPVASATLETLGTRLGADVAVCVRGLPVRMSGIGEGLEAIRFPRAVPIVLVNPGFPVGTAHVFARRAAGFSTALPDPLPALDGGEAVAAVVREGGNDLLAPALALRPEIGAVLATLERTPGALVAAMSGSGATCFALYGDEAASAAAAAALAQAHPDWWVTSTRLNSA